MMTKRILALFGLSLSLSLAACGGEEASAGEGSSASPATAEAPAAPAEAAQPTGAVIEVKMVTDGANNYFEPAEIVAKQGDVIRFVQAASMPHNVSFPADKNANASGLPAAGPYLTAPGQTYDLTVDFAPGSYSFQCDPHVMMGMVGSLTVQ